MGDWFHIINLAGVAVCAISGTLMAYQKRMDGFGVVVLASVTAIGGGTLRDMVLDLPVFWVQNTDYLYITLLAAFITIIWLRFSPRFPYHYLLIADAFGLALFNIVGLEKALMVDAPMAVAIAMGTITGVFGGLLRDVICREIPLVLNGELYAITCIVGGLGYAIAYYMELSSQVCMTLALVITILMRLGAMRWHWQLPVFHSEQPKN
ncbi:trimeric intracellular cation channel family protein [Alteromonas sp. ASW11-130]|uniref:trimeric intracellular cation channel family protein n=1 Tax=Alteromonas sp. ASW11-130 TaxID=3015775 RepID=UPI002241FCBC|nr:trimeric intracellular cation channel family protein [Alteromonas sp. ASW11-130]MCW8093349.1 trimeric intracellular cation channel family protein [Alteromonas sp. ASW11-130]